MKQVKEKAVTTANSNHLIKGLRRFRSHLKYNTPSNDFQEEIHAISCEEYRREQTRCDEKLDTIFSLLLDLKANV